ncbi:MAG TPA: MraY family glycosyltransferase [Bryobacteraceae bacterium]|jgi:UDP-GlcNAc:undecaprenyl-phosphate GlcNAc-1-phosphate transferase
MYSLLFLGFVSFGFALLLTPLVRTFFRRTGLAHRGGPQSGAEAPTRPIPRAGGVAIVISYLAAYLCLLALPLHAGFLVRDSLTFALRLLPAGGLIFLIGLADDLKGLEPWQKLAGEVAAAGAAYWAGVHLQGLAGYAAPGGISAWWNLPATILWLVACTNAINLIDGVDGLATGVGLFATCTTLIAALLQNNTALALATVPLAGCLLGFIRYNFNPASIFLGDCGSLFIGFLLGCYAVVWSQKAATLLGMTAPLMALSIPLLDLAVAISRRFLRRQALFEGDHNHIHHRLLNRGFTPRKVALVLYACAAAGAVCSLVVMNRNWSGLIILAFCMTTWIGVQHLGYVEFGVAGRLFVDGAFRRLLNSHISLESLEESLAAASTPEDCWNVLRRGCRECGFCRIEVDLAGRKFRECAEVQPFESWKVSVPISGFSSIELYRGFGPAQQHQVVASFVDLLRRVLAPKCAVFERTAPAEEQAVEMVASA